MQRNRDPAPRKRNASRGDKNLAQVPKSEFVAAAEHASIKTLSSAHEFANPSVTAPRSARGADKRLAILRVLSGSTLPLTAREIAQRTGIAPRTVRYHLRQMVSAGLVERSGSKPYTVYAITRAGVAAYHHQQQVDKFRARKGVGKFRSCSGVGAEQTDSVIRNCDSVCDTVYVVRGSLEWQPMGLWGGEVGLRARWQPFRRILEAVAGLRLPKKRLKRVMFYVRDGVVHFDFVVVGSREDFALEGLWLVKDRVFALLLLCLSLLKYFGFGREVVDALWSAAPVLRL